MEEKSKPYSIFLATQESFFGEINISSLKYNSTWNLKKRHIYYVSEKPGKQISHLFFHPHGLSIREDRYLSCGGWYWGFRITTDSAYLFCCFCYSHGKMNSVDIVFIDVFFVMFLLFLSGWQGVMDHTEIDGDYQNDNKSTSIFEKRREEKNSFRITFSDYTHALCWVRLSNFSSNNLIDLNCLSCVKPIARFSLSRSEYF